MQLDKLTALDMTPMGFLGRKTSTQNKIQRAHYRANNPDGTLQGLVNSEADYRESL